MDKGEFNRWLFEVMNTVTLVAERRGRILGFLYATLEETSARIVFLAVLPEYRRRGIGTALHHELKAHIPREEDAKPLGLTEHLYRSMEISHRLYKDQSRDGYASSEFFFLALAKSHPDLQDASPSEALMRISLWLGLPPDEIGLCESRARDVGYLDFPALLDSYWSKLQPAYLYPNPAWNGGRGDLFHQALEMYQRQPVCSSDCPGGDDRYHQLLSLAYWHHCFNGGKPFGLEQTLLGKILDCSQRHASTLLRRAIREGHLTRADSRTPCEAKLSGKTYEYLWTTGTVLPNRAINSRGSKGVEPVTSVEMSRKREERGGGNRPAASGMSDSEFLQRASQESREEAMASTLSEPRR
jgi:hypothetical protein